MTTAALARKLSTVFGILHNSLWTLTVLTYVWGWTCSTPSVILHKKHIPPSVRQFYDDILKTTSLLMTKSNVGWPKLPELSQSYMICVLIPALPSLAPSASSIRVQNVVNLVMILPFWPIAVGKKCRTSGVSHHTYRAAITSF